MTIKEEILFNASFKDAQKSLDKFAKDTGKSLQGIEKAFAAMGAVAAAAVAAFVGGKFIGALEDAVKAASDSEKAVNQLNTALALAGDYTSTASIEMQKFADTMQATTVFEDDLIINQLALAKSFGATNEQAQKMVKAAADLASATGVSLDTAVDQLGKTLQGTSGALGKTIPGLKGLSAEALKSGAAIDLIAKRFGGAAEAAAQTFSGSIAQLSNTFGNLQEEMGNVIIKNPAVLAGIQGISKIISSFTDLIIANQDSLGGMVTALTELAFNALPFVVDAFTILGKTILFGREIFLRYAIAVTDVIGAMFEFKTIQGLFKFVFDAIRNHVLNVTAVLSGLLEALAQFPGADKFLRPAIDGLDAMGTKIAGINADSALSTFQGGIQSVNAGLQTSLSNSDALFKSFTEGAAKARTFAEGLATSVSSAVPKDQEKGLQVLNASAQEGKKDSGNKKLMDSFTNGAKIFADAFATSVNISMQVFNGGFVNQFSSFVQQIGQAPQAFLDAFKNLDGIITGLLDSLPKVIQELLNKLPGIIESIIQRIPELVKMVIKAFSALASIIADQAPAIINALLDGVAALIDALPEIMNKLIAGLPALFKAILQKLPLIITALFKALPKIVNAIFAIIPEMIVIFLEALPDIIQSLVTGILTAIPQIIFGFIDAFIIKGGIFKIIFAIIKAIPQIAIALVVGSIDAMKNLIPEVIGTFSKMFSGNFVGKISEFFNGPNAPHNKMKEFFTGPNAPHNKIKEFFTGPNAPHNKLKEFFTGPNAPHNKMKEAFMAFIQKLKDALKKLTSFGGGGGGGGGGGVLGFASGGMVKVPGGYPNDSFPARLTSGELVVDRNLTERLAMALDRADGGGIAGPSFDLAALAEMIQNRPAIINVKMNEQNLASAMYRVRTRGFKI